MESLIVHILNILSEKVSNETFIIIASIFLIFIVNKSVFKPIMNKIASVPSLEDHAKLIRTCTENSEILHSKLILIERNLDKIQANILDSLANNKVSEKEAEDLKREISDIRNIILQFQGHMMYGNSDVFGNKSIR